MKKSLKVAITNSCCWFLYWSNFIFFGYFVLFFIAVLTIALLVNYVNNFHTLFGNLGCCYREWIWEKAFSRRYSTQWHRSYIWWHWSSWKCEGYSKGVGDASFTKAWTFLQGAVDKGKCTNKYILLHRTSSYFREINGYQSMDFLH